MKTILLYLCSLLFAVVVFLLPGLVVESFTLSVPWWDDKGNLRLEIPPRQWFDDIITDNQEYLEAAPTFWSLNRWFSILNQALWVFVAPIFMGVFIYAWFVMVTSQWDSEKMKRGIRILIYAGLGLGLVLLSYVLVNLLVNLF